MKSIEMNSAYVILMCVICEPFLIDAASVGDACQVARSRAQGECKVINNCQSAIDELVNQGLFPNQCGLMGRDQIVCCPIPVSNIITTSTAPVPTRISQRSMCVFFISISLSFFLCFQMWAHSIIAFST